MSLHRLRRKTLELLLLLVVVVVVVVAVLGSPRVAGSVAVGASAQPVASAGQNKGSSSAVPPVLPPATSSQLAVIRQAEAGEAAARGYELPASARYSLAELNGYASASR